MDASGSAGQPRLPNGAWEGGEWDVTDARSGSGAADEDCLGLGDEGEEEDGEEEGVEEREEGTTQDEEMDEAGEEAEVEVEA